MRLYMTLQICNINYHRQRQVPAPGPIFPVAGHKTCQDLA